MRVLAAFLLIGVALAGCASEATEPVDEILEEPMEYVPGPGSHPDFGFPVRLDLPNATMAPDGWPEYWVMPTGRVLPDEITGLVDLGTVNGVTSGSGITIFGSLAFVGAWQSQNLWAVDISNMDEPKVIGHLQETVVGDIETIAFPPSEEHPEGRLILVISTRGQTMQVVDATDPTNMTIVGVIESNGNHNHQILPGTPIVYNARSGNKIDIYDLSIPEEPRHVADIGNEHGCHAFDFFIDASQDKYLGFCAAYQVTQIFDVRNATNPVLISSSPFPLANQDIGDGSARGASFSHLATANHDGTVMIMGDETGGGAAPGCDFHARDPVTGTSVTGPVGNLYFYDITDPANPVLHGAVSPSAWDQRGSCTAHFGNVIEDRNQLVMAYYTVGVVLVDFTDLDNPYIVDTGGRDEGDGVCTLCGVWDAQYYQGHVLTGDIDKGMGFLAFE